MICTDVWTYLINSMERIEIRVPNWIKDYLKSKDNMSNYIRGLIIKDMPLFSPIKKVPCIKKTGQMKGQVPIDERIRKEDL